MAWRDLVQSLEASARRAQLAATRRHRMSETAKRQQEYEIARFERKKAQLQAAERATDDVQRFEQYRKAIVELHKDCLVEWDWQDIINAPQPPTPVLTKERENAARSALDTYKPGVFARAFGRGARRITKLNLAVDQAASADARENAEVLRRYQEQVTTWDIERRIAKLVLAKDPGGYKEALQYVDVLGELGDFGSRASIARAQPDLLVVQYAVSERDTIPTEQPSLNGAGNVVPQKMPPDQHSTLFRDHVCSAALRIARDIFSVLPVAGVIVNVSHGKTNSITGYRASETILAARFLRSSLAQIDLTSAVPADIVGTVQHRMKFHKAIGFELVEPISADERDPEPLAME